MVDLSTGERRPTRALLEALLEHLAGVSTELESRTELAAAGRMSQTNGAIAQRSAAQGGGARAVAEWLAQCFLDSPAG